ncbi:hypothetical protein DV515_00001472 [Chloebia gouldiae]|uniref:Uncharacterized protein n=1 Tax=Chloebia gouldiae TaxID=44316 RepID=A0A3L8SYL5_CHLGU|nr:hypothetical protein DV515_00001472 [Chloebia gouldiae]
MGAGFPPRISLCPSSERGGCKKGLASLMAQAWQYTPNNLLKPLYSPAGRNIFTGSSDKPEHEQWVEKKEMLWDSQRQWLMEIWTTSDMKNRQLRVPLSTTLGIIHKLLAVICAVYCNAFPCNSSAVMPWTNPKHHLYRRILALIFSWDKCLPLAESQVGNAHKHFPASSPLPFIMQPYGERLHSWPRQNPVTGTADWQPHVIAGLSINNDNQIRTATVIQNDKKWRHVDHILQFITLEEEFQLKILPPL